MSKKKPSAPPSKQWIEEVVECDTAKLFTHLPEAIKYLQRISNQYPDIQLGQTYDSDCDDWVIRFYYMRLETDEEFADRLESEEEARLWRVELERLQAIALQEKAEKEVRRKQWETLDREFGRHRY